MDQDGDADESYTAYLPALEKKTHHQQRQPGSVKRRSSSSVSLQIAFAELLRKLRQCTVPMPLPDRCILLPGSGYLPSGFENVPVDD